MCNRSPARKCTRCQSCSYSSTKCQKSDFCSHKLPCRPLTEQSPRPSPEHMRTIFLPANQPKPSLVGFRCEPVRDGFDPAYPIIAYEPENRPYLGLTSGLS
ncbi:hypothetical protein BDW68DRAFT_159875 [Aspergillus falconensis]